jgi:hypothetical protein
MRESARKSIRHALLVAGLLVPVLAAPSFAQQGDSGPKDRPKLRNCIMSIFVIRKDGVPYRCWYRSDPKKGCVPMCEPRPNGR